MASWRPGWTRWTGSAWWPGTCVHCTSYVSFLGGAEQLWVGYDVQLEAGLDTSDRVSLLAGSLIRAAANGELREQVLNQVQQRSQG